MIENSNPQKRRMPASRRIRIAAASIACILLAVALHAQSVTVIKGGTVLAMTDETLKSDTVILRDGKIEAVGVNLQPPPGAAVIDATGKFVMPGIIDAMSYYGLANFPINDDADPVTPQNRIIEAFYPYGKPNRGAGGLERDPEILSGGITTLYIAPGDRQVIGGQGAVVKTAGRTFDSMVLREPASIDMTIGETAKYPPAQRKVPATRMGVVTLIRKALLNAQEYGRTWDDYSRKSDEDKQKGSEPERDYGAEVLSRLLRREIPARIEVDFVDDIRTAVRLSEEYGFSLIVDSGIGAYRIRDVLAQKRIPVVLGPVSHPFITGGEVSMTEEAYELMNENNAAMLARAGVKIALASFGAGFGTLGSPTQARWLLLEAAIATGYGLSEQDALKALTINAAEILGVDSRVGSIKAGKDADIIILSGHPLAVNTRVERVFVGGVPVFTR